MLKCHEDTNNPMESKKNVEQTLDHLQQHNENNSLGIMQLKEEERENLTDKVIAIFQNNK